ncbi:MAG: FAD-dependent oxidoreductase [Syntrophales bacterium]
MEKFDVIIVGAGLSGLACAYTLAGKGLEILVLERGDYPGSKNVSGGRLYVNPVRDLFPDLWENAPVERFIAHEGIVLMAANRSIALNYSGDELLAEPHQSYSVLRSKFDRWLAERVEEKGAMLLPKVRVDNVIKENGRISGVIAAGDELRADAVVACDGVLSLISEMAGLRLPGSPRHYAVGLKEIIALDSRVINDRFNLQGDEGAARLFLGDITRGMFGGGFLYTNKESVSLGLVIGLGDLLGKKPEEEVPALLDRFKERPEISSLIKGGETLEYSAHLIPEGGYGALGSLCGNGILVAGDAAGLALNIGFTVRGMEYALASGYFAAQAILRAKESGGFDMQALSSYEEMMEKSFVLEDIRNFRETPRVLSNPRFFNHYPEMIGNIMRDMYAVPDGPKGKLFPSLRKYFTLGEIWSILKDLREMMKI